MGTLGSERIMMVRKDDILNGDRLLTPGEVAEIFRVDPKTVTRWAGRGQLASIRTIGGHRRFRASEVRRLLKEWEA